MSPAEAVGSPSHSQRSCLGIQHFFLTCENCRARTHAWRDGTILAPSLLPAVPRASRRRPCLQGGLRSSRSSGPSLKLRMRTWLGFRAFIHFAFRRITAKIAAESCRCMRFFRCLCLSAKASRHGSGATRRNAWRAAFVNMPGRAFGTTTIAFLVSDVSQWAIVLALVISTCLNVLLRSCTGAPSQSRTAASCPGATGKRDHWEQSSRTA